MTHPISHLRRFGLALLLSASSLPAFAAQPAHHTDTKPSSKAAPKPAAKPVAQPAAQPTVSPLTTIRGVDFLNFTYPTSVCAEDFPEFGRKVSVKKGQFRNRDLYYRLVENRVHYADVSGDGAEDAVVHVICGSDAGNYYNSEFFVYGLSQGTVTLLARLDDRDMERDYVANYADGFLWGVAYRGVKPGKGMLTIQRLAEGPHAWPTHIVTMNYRFQGKGLSLAGKPARKQR